MKKNFNKDETLWAKDHPISGNDCVYYEMTPKINAPAALTDVDAVFKTGKCEEERHFICDVILLNL